MNIKTKHHRKTCGVADCSATRTQTDQAGGVWVHVDGHIYSDERRCWVVHQWSCSCAEHATDVADAIAATLEDQDSAWRVQTVTADYSTDEPVIYAIDREGNATPQPGTSFQDTLF